MDENHRFNVLEGQIADLHSMVARNFLILEQKADKIMSALTDLQASVAAEDTVIASVVTLLQGLSAALAAAGTDPAALAALKADIDTQTQTMAAAVTANTPPPAPTTTPPPAPQAARR
jgi:hypothetical protein